MRYTKASRSAKRARQISRADLGDAEPVSKHHGDQFDTDNTSSGKLSLAPVRELVQKIPQTWELTESTFKEPNNPVNQCGAVLEDCVPVVTSNDFDSFVAAFGKRANNQPDADDDIEEDVVAEGIRLIKSWGTRLPNYQDTDEIWEEWLSKFNPEKRRRMVIARGTLFECEYDYKYLHEKSLSVKIEVLLKRYDDTWAPRLIYASTDAFNALTGPIVNNMMGRLNEFSRSNILGKCDIMFCYKRQDTECAQHLNDPEFPYCFEGDFSSNDLLQRRSMWRVVDAVYEKLGATPELRKLFKAGVQYTVKNHDYGLKGLADGPFATGTTQTTFRNCAVNFTIFGTFIMHKFGHLPDEVVCKVCILGDDILVVCKYKFDVEEWEEWARKWKMKLKAVHTQIGGSATLLSRRICVHTETWCMMPKLGKAIARFNARASKNASVSDSAYMAGKALSYAYEFRHFPLFRDIFLQRYESEDDKAIVDPSEVSWFTRQSGVDLSRLVESIYAEKVLASEDSTREFIMDAYGYTIGLVETLEITRRVVLSKRIEQVPWPRELSIDM